MPSNVPQSGFRIPRYIVFFLLLFAGLYALFVSSYDALLPYFSVLTRAVYGLLSLFYEGFSWDGNLLKHPSFVFEITRGCDGITSIILIVAAIVPFPAGMREKAIGLLVAIPVILVVNYFRIVLLALTKLHAPTYFQFMHAYVFQGLMVLFTFGLFAGWLFLYVRRPG